MRALALAALWPAAAAAAESAGRHATPLPGVEGLATTFLGLGLILALIFGGAWVVRRLGGLPAGGKGLVRVLGGASVGTRERVVVVEVEGARLVLGVAPGRVQTLHVLPAGAGFEQSLQRAREGS
jgi:flagellar protein FliO/FliZ